jgi:succinoglycan biosynthesis transport protein ExoP
MDLRKILLIIKRWLWLLVLGAVIAGGLGYYFSSRESPIYRTSTRFVILRAASTGYTDYYSYLDYQNMISTYAQLLSSVRLLERVSDDVGFTVLPNQANAEQIGETQFVRLTVTHEDPEKAAIIANALVDVLIETNEELQSVRYEATEQNLKNRTDQAMEQMEILQNQIQELSITTLQEQIDEVKNQIDDLQAQTTDLEFKIGRINPQFASEEQSLLRLQYQAELNQAQPILDLYQNIYTQLMVMKEPIQNEDVSSTRMAQLERTLGLYEQIYFSSISSLETLNLTRAQSTPNVVQVEPATAPKTPYTPKPFQSAGIGAAVGLLIVAGIVFMIEYLDDTIKTPDDVKDILGLPVIGLIADMGDYTKRRSDNGGNVYVFEHPRSPITEAFRSLRTSLEFYSIDSPLQMLIVTSAGPEEGKTTIATNLTTILARENKNVLLIDADLRRPNVHNLMGISNRAGLSDLLRGKLKMEDIIQTSPVNKNMHVITSGSLPPNPAELIASNRMEAILEELRSQFEVIVIDTPPAIVTDAQLLGSRADGVIYVLRPGKTRSVAAKTPFEEFQRVGANIIGVVMNRIPKNRGYYYGGYDYYAPGTMINEKYYRYEERDNHLNGFDESMYDQTMVENIQEDTDTVS